MIVCIYCDYKEQTRQTVPELIASLLKQVIQDQPPELPLSKNIETLYEHHKKQDTRPTCKEFRDAFRSEIGTSSVFIVVDALDEYPECNQVHLITELQSLASNVRLMITSRPLPIIEELFRSATQLEIRATNGDVRKYLEHRMLHERRLVHHIKCDPILQMNIVEKVTASTRGMYGFPMFTLTLDLNFDILR